MIRVHNFRGIAERARQSLTVSSIGIDVSILCW